MTVRYLPTEQWMSHQDSINNKESSDEENLRTIEFELQLSNTFQVCEVIRNQRTIQYDTNYKKKGKEGVRVVWGVNLTPINESIIISGEMLGWVHYQRLESMAFSSEIRRLDGRVSLIHRRVWFLPLFFSFSITGKPETMHVVASRNAFGFCVSL